MASKYSHRGSTSTDRPGTGLDKLEQAASSSLKPSAVEEVGVGGGAMNGEVRAKPCHELHRAVFHAEESRVKELLAIKLNPNAQDKHGECIL